MDYAGLSCVFHAPGVIIGKALKGAAVVNYCKPLITPPVGTPGSALRVTSFLLKRCHETRKTILPMLTLPSMAEWAS